jgi:hypothetical protein
VRRDIFWAAAGTTPGGASERFQFGQVWFLKLSSRDSPTCRRILHMRRVYLVPGFRFIFVTGQWGAAIGKRQSGVGKAKPVA